MSLILNRRDLLSTLLLPHSRTSNGQTKLPRASSCGACFSTREAVASSHIDTAIAQIDVLHYDKNAPLAPATYLRYDGPQRHPGIIQSADGAYWRHASVPVNCLSFGGDGGGIQRALNSLGGAPGRVYVPGGTYVIDTPLRLFSGQSLYGDGFATIPGRMGVEGGTRLVVAAGGVGIEISSENRDAPIERVALEGLAIEGTHARDGGSAIVTNNTRYLRFENLYIHNFRIGIECKSTSWLNSFRLTQVFGCGTGIYLNSGSEDSSFISCICRYCDVGLHLNYHSQCSTFISCDFSHARVGVLMVGGRGMKMSAQFLGCIFEYSRRLPSRDGGRSVSSVFQLDGVDDADVAHHPSISLDGCRFHNEDAGGDATILFISFANRVSIANSRSGGLFRHLLCLATSRSVVREFVAVGNETIATDTQPCVRSEPVGGRDP